MNRSTDMFLAQAAQTTNASGIQIGTRTVTLGSSGTSPLTDPNNVNLIDLANMAVAYALILAGFLAVVFILWGGISFILSGGKPEKVKSAVDTIRYAIVGLLIVIFSFTIVAVVGRIFGYDLIQYLRLDSILEIVNRVANRQ